MIEVDLEVPASSDQVFEVLADGWLYASWVVGAAHIRDVDKDWPARGSMIHHGVGVWPLTRQDVTKVTEVDDHRSVELEARMWPAGTAKIRITIEPIDAQHSRIRMAEQVVKGPLGILPAAVQARGLKPRNRESLRRLGDIAANRRKDG